MALNVKQKYPGTQGGALRFWHSLVTQKKRASIYTLVKIIQRKHGYFKLQQLQRWRNYCSVEWGKTLEKTQILHLLCLLISSRQCRRYFAYIFFVVTYVCFVFEPQVVFYCNFSCSRHMSKSANLIGRIVFYAARQTKKTNPRRFFLNDAFTRAVFRVGVHTHIGALCLVTRR